MMKWRRLVTAFVTCAAFFSCIDEINLSMEESNQALVIDAWMGNTPEETYVKIYRTNPYISGVSNPNFVNIAVERVVIEEKNGQTIPFSQVEPTIFKQLWSFQPEPGKEYRLVVELSEEEIYESPWEVMPPRVEIEDLVPRAVARQVMITTGDTQFFQTRTFVDVQGRITDPGVDEIGYLIETSGISELYASSKNEHCACSCYEDEPNIFGGMNVVSNENFQGKSFDMSLGEFSLSYLGRYLVKSRLRTLTQTGYQYINRINEQQRNSGSIFDPAPSRIKGNIRKRGSEDEWVLGGFFLFQETTFEKLLYRTEIRAAAMDLKHSMEPLPEVGVSCVEFYTNATDQVPSGFKP
jgi:hypothetical protein